MPTFADALQGSCGFGPLLLLAHDRPGFGLTSRPHAVSGYSEARAAELALALIDSYEMRGSLLLCGHSLGCAQAVRMAARRPRDVRALVLLAPALLPSARRWAVTVRDLRESPAGIAAAAGITARCAWMLARIGPIVSGAWRKWMRVAGAGALVAVVMGAACAAARLVLFGCLHSAFFWRFMLVNAYCDTRKLTPQMVFWYRWVTRVRGADEATLCYLVALVQQAWHSLWPTPAGPPANEPPGLGSTDGALPMVDDDTLWREVCRLGIPVLIVHGRQDRVIPPWNSRRLLAQLPRTGRDQGRDQERVELVELDRCGHNVHEECPSQLAEAVASFLARKQL